MHPKRSSPKQLWKEQFPPPPLPPKIAAIGEPITVREVPKMENFITSTK